MAYLDHPLEIPGDRRSLPKDATKLSPQSVCYTKAYIIKVVEFASRVAAHAMSEIEVLEPAAVLVGDAVRQQMAASK